MTIQTWTRPANAKAAAVRMLKDADMKFVIETITPFKHTTEEGVEAFAVRVELDNIPSEVDELSALIEGKLELVAKRPEPKKIEKLGLTIATVHNFGLGKNEATAECPHCGVNHFEKGHNVHHATDHPNKERRFRCNTCGGEWGKLNKEVKPRIAKDRASSLKGFRLRVVGGASAANPYRIGSLSHKAFDLVQQNPDLTFEDFKEMGGRVRTLQEDVKAGRIRTL